MSFKNLTIERVRQEIGELIKRYPDRTGSEDEESEKSCVYYADYDGYGVVGSRWDSGNLIDLVTPVCIIGQWVEDFHPELKEDSPFGRMLCKNEILATSEAAKLTFNEEVHNFLGYVQSQQDRDGSGGGR